MKMMVAHWLLGTALTLKPAAMKMIVTHWLGEYFVWLLLAVFAFFLAILTVAFIMFIIRVLHDLILFLPKWFSGE